MDHHLRQLQREAASDPVKSAQLALELIRSHSLIVPGLDCILYRRGMMMGGLPACLAALRMLADALEHTPLDMDYESEGAGVLNRWFLHCSNLLIDQNYVGYINHAGLGLVDNQMLYWEGPFYTPSWGTQVHPQTNQTGVAEEISGRYNNLSFSWIAGLARQRVTRDGHRYPQFVVSREAGFLVEENAKPFLGTINIEITLPSTDRYSKGYGLFEPQCKIIYNLPQGCNCPEGDAWSAGCPHKKYARSGKNLLTQKQALCSLNGSLFSHIELPSDPGFTLFHDYEVRGQVFMPSCEQLKNTYISYRRHNGINLNPDGWPFYTVGYWPICIECSGCGEVSLVYRDSGGADNPYVYCDNCQWVVIDGHSGSSFSSFLAQHQPYVYISESSNSIYFPPDCSQEERQMIIERHRGYLSDEEYGDLSDPGLLADDGIYYIRDLADLREQCSELDSIDFSWELVDDGWENAGWYLFDFENGKIIKHKK